MDTKMAFSEKANVVYAALDHIWKEFVNSLWNHLKFKQQLKRRFPDKPKESFRISIWFNRFITS